MNTLYQPTEATKQFIQSNWDSDPVELALQASRYPSVDMVWAVQQISGRRKAKAKLPLWYANEQVYYPPSLSMEQCSSEATAKYKATVCSGSSLLDVTGGFGVDIAFMSSSFSQSHYVESNELLAAIAQHNFSVLGLPAVDVSNGNAIDFIMQNKEVDWLYIDPARRKLDRKAILLSDCEPNIAELQPLLLQKARNVLIKLSPLFDVKELLRTFPDAKRIHIVAAANECKEVLLELSRAHAQAATVACVNIQKNGELQHFEFNFNEEQLLGFSTTPQPLKYLYEANAAIQKAGCFKSYAHVNGLQMLHPNSKLYTSNERLESFQGRRFVVDAVLGFSKQGIKEGLGDVEKANITVRNFPISVAELRKRLKLQDGGDVYLFATTLLDGRKVLIRCRKDS